MGNPIPSRDARDLYYDIFHLEPREGCPAAERSLDKIARFEAQIRADAYEQAQVNVSRALSDQPDSTDEGLAELLREAGNFVANTDCECDSYYGHTCLRCTLHDRIDTALSTGRQA